MTIDKIADYFKKQGIAVSENQHTQLKSYVDLLKEWNNKIHLVSKGDIAHIEERHILPSFLFAHYVKNRFQGNSINIVDLGTGAGLPGIVLAILFPGYQFWLVESSRKKTLFLNKVKKELQLTYTVVNERFEQWQGRDQLKIDLITARAVASIKDLLFLTKGVLKAQSTILLTMKSCDLDESIPKTIRDEFKLSVIKNKFVEISGYLKDKCLVSMEYLHGREKTI